VAGALVAIAASGLLMRSRRYSGRPSELEVVADNEAAQRRRFVAEVAGLLRRGAYEELDRLARDLRGTKARFANGSWKLAAFYDTFSPRCDEADGGPMRERLGAAQDWVQKRPDSVAAKIALAEALFAEAADLRGGGYAKTVEDRTWAAMDERVQRALGLLSAARAQPERCPGWWAVRMHLAFYESLERADYDRFFEEAVALEPEYDVFYGRRAYYLLPRWGGREGEWEADLEARAGARPELYARTVWDVHELDVYENPFKETRVSWPLAKSGFEAMVKRHPESLEVRSAFCAFSVMAADRAQAASLFDSIGPRVDLSVWRTRDWFQNAWQWANHPS
jgi:hypothetical protein